MKSRAEKCGEYRESRAEKCRDRRKSRAKKCYNKEKTFCLGGWNLGKRINEIIGKVEDGASSETVDFERRSPSWQDLAHERVRTPIFSECSVHQLR